MEEITKEQKLEFAQKEFPGQEVNIPNNADWWYIQAGTLLGGYLHYEYWGNKVNLHIEGPDWRPIRNYLWREVSDPRVVSSKWWRQGCCWTLQKELNNWEDIKQGFLELDRIMRPHILSFERQQGFEERKNTFEEMQDVEAHKIKIGELLKFSNLVIPDYQRPYRWTTKNVEQLLTDINHARITGKLDYLLGSVILHHNQANLLEIVDGQQRLTTISLIARSLDKEINLPPLQFGHVDSATHIRENFKFIERWESLNLKEGERQEFIDFIFNNCRVVMVTVKRLSEAFQLFETQNGRGKPLEAYNLLKAYHIRAMVDAERKDKIECDVRWEDAALYSDKQNISIDLLRQLINEHLFRSRVWSRSESANRFTRNDVDEFKGLTIGRDSELDFAYQNSLVQQQIALGFIQSLNRGLFKVKSRFEHGDPDNMSAFVNINQLIINGKPFFDYIETYVEMYKRLFLQSNSSQLAGFKDFYLAHCHYPGCQRSGDGYIRQAYKSAILMAFDRFGEKGVNYLYEAIYVCLYRLRLTMKQVRYSTMTSNSNVGWILATIQKAKNFSDLAPIIRKSEEYRNNIKIVFDVAEIKDLFNQ